MAWLLYWVFFSPRTDPDQVNINGVIVNVGPGGQLPNINGSDQTNTNSANVNRPPVSYNTNAALPIIDKIANGGLTLTDSIADSLSTFTTKSIDGDGLNYYDREDGKFYRLSPDDMTYFSLSDQKFYSVNNVIWSPTKDKAILEYPDGSKTMYDFTNEKQYTLPDEYQDINFDPSGREISFKFLSPDANYLAIANADGTGMQPVEDLADVADNFDANYSPTGQIVGTYTESIAGEAQEVFFIGKYGENFRSIEIDGKGFESQWSDDGQQLLYSAFNSYNDYNPNLYIVDASGDNIGDNKIDLGLTTWADKCSFAGSSSVICAVPVNLERGSGPFPELAASSPDIFYRVDLNTGIKSQLAIPVNETGGGQFQAHNIFVDDTGEWMYFTDGFTGQIHKIQLQ